MTLYEALFNFQDLYLTRLADSSRRISDPIATDWQKISNEYDLYFQATGQGDYATGSSHLNNIVTILNGYGLVVDEPIQAPLPLGVYASPSVIDVPVDFFGLNPDYTNSFSRVYVYMGGIDDSANWTYAITGNVNTVANISDHNRINVTSLTADYGTVTIEMSKTNYSTLTFILTANKRYDPEAGLVINEYPDTIVIPCDPVGTPLSYAQAYSDIVVREGNTDETVNWAMSVTGTTAVSANISGGNRVNITNISAFEGFVEVTCTRAAYDAQTVYVYAQKQLQGQAVIDGSSVDNVTIELNVSDELQLKDGGVTTPKLGDASVTTPKLDSSSIFNTLGTLIDYQKEDNSRVLVPTVLRRAPGSLNASIETGHSIGSGRGNIAIGINNIIGPEKGATKYEVEDFNQALNRVFLKTSEGNVAADFVVAEKILLWNDDGSTTLSSGYEDNYRYYIHGTIVSSAWTGSQTTVDITPAYTVDDQFITYFTGITSTTDTLVCSHYVETGFPFVEYDNVMLGNQNRVNGSNNIVLGTLWDLNEGPEYFGASGNVLIGNGTGVTVTGNLNIFVINMSGNQAPLIYNSGSVYNAAIGFYHTVGDSGDVSGRKGNSLFGWYNQAKSSGSLLMGSHAVSNSDGEIVLGGGDLKRRKVMLQLTARTTSTAAETLQMFKRSTPVGTNIVTPGNFNVVQDSLYSFTLDFLGIQSDGDVYRRKYRGAIKNIGGTTSIVGSVTNDATYDIDEFTVAGVSITADDGSDQLVVTVTPAESTATEWLAWAEGEVVEI